MHHMLVDAASAWVDLVRTDRKILVFEHTPDADDLDSLGFVRVDKEVISHRSQSYLVRCSSALKKAACRTPRRPYGEAWAAHWIRAYMPYGWG
jgi:hypothetical protein